MEEKNKKYNMCPLLASASVAKGDNWPDGLHYQCVRDKCAWWAAVDIPRCAISLMARELYYIRDEKGYCPRCKDYSLCNKDSWDEKLGSYVCNLCGWRLVHPGDLIDHE